MERLSTATQKAQRRVQVDHLIDVHLHLAERLRDIPLPGAKLECDVLQRKLVALRAERRALESPWWRP